MMMWERRALFAARLLAYHLRRFETVPWTFIYSSMPPEVRYYEYPKGAPVQLDKYAISPEAQRLISATVRLALVDGPELLALRATYWAQYSIKDFLVKHSKLEQTLVSQLLPILLDFDHEQRRYLGRYGFPAELSKLAVEIDRLRQSAR
jgi:hypothetical protein